MATTSWAKYHGIATKLAAVWGTDALSGHEGAADSGNSLMDRYLCVQRSLHVTSLDDFLRQFDGFGYLKTATSSTWICHYRASSYWDPHLCTPLEPPKFGRWITRASPCSSTAMTTTGWWSISPPGAEVTSLRGPAEDGSVVSKTLGFSGEWADLCGVY